ncbi:MAG: hypothetical protein WBA13_08735 [Microcoleaceae cyanobacterium]
MVIYSKIDSTQTDLDLLQALFEEESIYPWNPIQSDSVAYLAELETEFELSECFTDAEVNHKSQALFAQVEQLYSVTTLQQSILQKFAGQVPRDLLHRLAQAALQAGEKMSDCSVSLADGLVECVQDILPQWQAEDLYVLARPFAYSMLGSEKDISQIEWTKMSEVEQARMSLAVARYALSKLMPTE